MTNPIIKVHNLGKRYRIGAKIDPKGRDNFRDAILNTLQAPFKNFKRLRALTRFQDSKPSALRPKPSALRPTPYALSPTPDADVLWALKDVSFEINKGDVVGIIGRNGSGKSTLLKILSRITEPTEGYVELRGRVASLLEVGTGFHRELTGRENIYLNGSILGMKKWEIDKKFDEIVAFSEIEKFIDTPVKHYSSGMYVRLAFAVAAHLDPDILLVDEVLAVGDAAFQKKCLGKMSDIAKGGRTVLFVSHNMGAVQQLTNTCLLLREGKLIFSGSTADAVDCYLNTSISYSNTVYNVEKALRRYPELIRQVEFISLELKNSSTAFIPADTDIDLEIIVRGNETVKNFRFSMTIFKIDGTPVGSVFGPETHMINKGEIATFQLQLHDPCLAPGKYFCGIATGKGSNRDGHVDFDIILDVLNFEVMAPEGVGGVRSAWCPGWGLIRFKEPLVKRVA